jgi:chemotaxis protein methyltransferase CheR
MAGFTVRSGPFGVAYRRPPARDASEEVFPVTGRRVAPPLAAARPVRAPARIAPREGEAGPRPPPAEPDPVEVPPDPDVVAARALLDQGRLAEAAAIVDGALARRPLDPELHLVRALGLLEAGRAEEAEAESRRALYLARGQPFLHLFTGLIRMRRGDRAGAARALRTAASLAARLPSDARVPMSHGLTAAALLDVARFHLRRLDGAPRPEP